MHEEASCPTQGLTPSSRVVLLMIRSWPVGKDEGEAERTDVMHEKANEI